MMGPNEKLYFPGLTGLRAFAAFLVLFTHVERFRMMAGLPAILGGPFNSFLGGLSVTFFFVLSGFLITSLLQQEKERTGAIGVFSFLRRRMRRIWPLYYTVLIAGYLLSIFVFSESSTDIFSNGLLLNLFLLPNIAFAFDMIPEIIIQIWSVGTEEQFYFIWPFLVRRWSVKSLSRIFWGLIAFWFVLRVFVHFFFPAQLWINVIIYRTRFDCMAIGGLFALAGNYRRLILHPATGVIGAVCFAGLLAASGRWDISFYQLYALLFGILLVWVSRKPGGWLESAPLKLLGKISYGIYLLHHFVIYFIFRGLPPFGQGNTSPLADLGVFVLTSLLTVLLASLSYRFFESPWLRRKEDPVKPLLSRG